MKLLRYLRSCVYDPTMYHDVPQWNSGRIIFHAAILTLIMAAALTINVTPRMYEMSDTLKSLAINGYPENLKMELRDGELTSNLAEPLVLNDEQGKPFVTVDTSVEYQGRTQFQSYNTRGLITKDVIVMNDNNGRLQIIPLTRFNDIQIDKENVLLKIDNLRNSLPYLSMIIFIGLAVFGGVFAALYYAIIGAIIKLMALLLDKEHVTWLHGRRIAVLASTVPLIFSTILIIFGSTIIPFLDTILIFIIAGINIHAFHKQPTQPSLPIQNPPESVS